MNTCGKEEKKEKIKSCNLVSFIEHVFHYHFVCFKLRELKSLTRFQFIEIDNCLRSIRIVMGMGQCSVSVLL